MGTWYNYNCGSCGKHCHKKTVLRCNFCNVPLCWSCKKEGLCPDHYQKLTPQERMSLNSTHLTFTWMFRIAFWAGLFGIIGAFGLWSELTRGIPLTGIISGAIGLVSCFLCFKAPGWEETKLNKTRALIHQRLGTSSGGINAETLLKAVQNFTVGLNVGTKPIQNTNLPPVNAIDVKPSQDDFIICPNCAAKMPEGTKFCGVCGKTM